ncbi:MAG: hypothetical protein QNJ54_29860 [Prochloraceae cyanobacterium]|nr:hypothetical protein [Prochloraceae cyanobacterium]
MYLLEIVRAIEGSNSCTEEKKKLENIDNSHYWLFPPAKGW